MYVPRAFAESRPGELFDFLEAHPLGTLVLSLAGELEASHLPFLVDRRGGAMGMLHAHVAKANPLAKAPSGSRCLVVFSGPQGYVTPTWYAAKRAHGKVVPTWNYVAVHVTGIVRVVEEPLALRRHLEELTARFEASRESDWEVDDAPREFIERQMQAIVGVDVEILQIEGKWKLSQNRSEDDVDGVVAGLAASDDPQDHELSRAVTAVRLTGRGEG